MSRILRRPMFRGGPVNSYNTGIASGLGEPGYADGGRVGFQEGKGMFDFFFPEIVTEEEAKTRPDIYSYTKRDPSKLLNLIPLGRLRTISKISPLSVLKQAGKYPEFPVGYPSRGLPLEKAPFLTNQYFKETLRPYASGATETLKQAGAGIKDFFKKYGIATGIGAGAAGTGYSIYKDLEGGEKNNKPTEGGTLEKTELDKLKEFYESREKKLKDEYDKKIANLTKVTKLTEEEDITKQTELYQKLLGGEEARAQAGYDALLAAAPAFFKGKNLREAAPQVLESINKSGAFDKPRDIKQAAAQLAIQRQIMKDKATAEERSRLEYLRLQQGFKQPSITDRLVKLGAQENFGGNLPSDIKKAVPGKFYVDANEKLIKVIQDPKTKQIDFIEYPD
jgi:hypothetical protein